MTFLRSINRFSGLFQFALKNVFSFSVWLPLLAFASLTGVILLGLTYYTEPFLYSVLNPYLRAVGSFTEQLGISPDFSSLFSHYPAHFRLLAGQFEWAKLPVALLLEGLAIALAARAFGVRYLNQRQAGNKGAVGSVVLPQFGFGAWMKVVMAWLLIYLMISAVAYSLPSLFESWLYGSPRRAQIFDVILFTLTNILIAPFVYIFPLFGLGTDSSRSQPNQSQPNHSQPNRSQPSLWWALVRSLQLFRRFPFASMFLVLLPSFLFVYPLTWAVSPSAGFASKLQPEFMVFLLSGLIVGNLFVNFLYAGATAKLIIEEGG